MSKTIELDIDGPLFCGNCRFLRPQEKDQTDKKEPHRCLIYGVELKHNGWHPEIPRLVECRYDPHTQKAIGEL